jgi:prepilin-type N-terminal cleavage/methylation domain-containing protein
MTEREESGFTILELLAAIAIMTVVATVAMPRIEGALRDSRVQVDHGKDRAYGF